MLKTMLKMMMMMMMVVMMMMMMMMAVVWVGVGSRDRRCRDSVAERAQSLLISAVESRLPTHHFTATVSTSS